MCTRVNRGTARMGGQGTPPDSNIDSNNTVNIGRDALGRLPNAQTPGGEATDTAVAGLLARAVEDGRKARYDAVLEACTAAGMWAPHSPLVEMLRAQALVGKEEWSGAEQSFSRCLDLLDGGEDAASGAAQGVLRAAVPAPDSLRAKCRQGLKVCRQKQRAARPRLAPSAGSADADQTMEPPPAPPPRFPRTPHCHMSPGFTGEGSGGIVLGSMGGGQEQRTAVRWSFSLL